MASIPDLQTVDFQALIDKHNDEGISIEEHFTPEELKEICEYEKVRLRNVKRNYIMLKTLGIAARVPDFMQKSSRTKVRGHVSEGDSDGEWVPAPTSRNRKAGTKASKRKAPWKPPVKSERAEKQVKTQDQAREKHKANSSGKKKTLPKVKMSAELERCFAEEESEEMFEGFTQSEIDESELWSEERVKANTLLMSHIEHDLNDEIRLGEELEEDTEDASTDLVHIPEEIEETNLDIQSEEGNEKRSRYPRRKLAKVNYKEERLLRDDDYIFCDDCGREHVGDCPIHGPLIAVADTQVANDGSDVIRAVHSLPKGIVVKTSHIPGAGEGVWAEEHLQKGLRFGPYEGIEVTDSVAAHKSGYCWLIYQDGDVISHYIDAQYQRFANWLRFVNCARYEEEQNLQAFQYRGQVYYRTIKPISTGTELLVWYGAEYAQELGIREEKSEIHALYKRAGFEVWECGVCERIYPSQWWMLNHKRSHGDRTGSKRYKCDLCTYSTDNSGHMMHHKLTHTGEKPHTCTVCGKGFTWRGHLVTHKATHTGERKYACTVCDYRAALAHHLRRHMRTHTGEQPHKCTVCDYRAAQAVNLRIHMRIHTGEMPYKCTVCDYRAVHAGSLRVHMRTHTGEKPHTCTVCDYRAAHAGALRTHMRTHTGEKPYKCTECDYRTAQAGSLRDHMRRYSHTPFTCELCSFIAISQDNLTRHRKVHSGVTSQAHTEE